MHKISLVSKTTASLVSFFVKPGIETQILETRPKKIVIFHFLLIKPVFEIIKKYNLDIPVLTVVTDPFTAHPIWFQQENQNYIVFSDILKEKCLERGINKENCGASISMEILMMGKVPVINNYIWEQEKGNMEFVCNSKLGILERNTRYLPDVLHRLLTDSEFYNSIINNIKNAAISNGVGQVSDYILKYQ